MAKVNKLGLRTVCWIYLSSWKKIPFVDLKREERKGRKSRLKENVFVYKNSSLWNIHIYIYNAMHIIIIRSNLLIKLLSAFYFLLIKLLIKLLVNMEQLFHIVIIRFYTRDLSLLSAMYQIDWKKKKKRKKRNELI